MEARHPLIGMAVKGQKGMHGVILDIIPSRSQVGDLVLIELAVPASTLDRPSSFRLIPLAELATYDKWVLYKSQIEMVRASTAAIPSGSLPPLM